ncbi:cobaltochelatase subunit [compost metagenome]
MVKQLAFSDALHRQVSELCAAAGVEGVRADLVLLRAACAHAAWQGQAAIGAADVEAVAELVLAHRRKAPAQEPLSAPSAASGGAAGQGAGGDWGELPPQAVPTQALAGVRPLPAKKS